MGLNSNSTCWLTKSHGFVFHTNIYTIFEFTIPKQYIFKAIRVSPPMKMNRVGSTFVKLKFRERKWLSSFFSLHFIMLSTWELMIWKIRIIVCHFYITYSSLAQSQIYIICESLKYRSPLSVVHELRKRFTSIKSLVLCKLFQFFLSLNWSACQKYNSENICIVLEHLSMLHFAFGRKWLYLFDICLSSTYVTHSSQFLFSQNWSMKIKKRST